MNEGCISSVFDRFSVAGAIMTDHHPRDFSAKLSLIVTVAYSSGGIFR
jgi:hypothetical protein